MKKRKMCFEGTEVAFHDGVLFFELHFWNLCVISALVGLPCYLCKLHHIDSIGVCVFLQGKFLERKTKSQFDDDNDEVFQLPFQI
jgi:hypothetical protein